MGVAGRGGLIIAGAVATNPIDMDTCDASRKVIRRTWLRFAYGISVTVHAFHGVEPRNESVPRLICSLVARPNELDNVLRSSIRRLPSEIVGELLRGFELFERRLYTWREVSWCLQ